LGPFWSGPFWFAWAVFDLHWGRFGDGPFWSVPGQTLQRIFTIDSLKEADLRKDVPFGVSMVNNHI